LSKFLNSSENKDCKFMADKFSVLHHWSARRIEDEPLKTFLKFQDIENNIVIKRLNDIPLNVGNKLTYEVSKKLALSAEDNNLPRLFR
jgi:hypothetical protein